MPINPSLLIAAPMLQDYLVDKDGTPMSAGTITCYQDNSRTTLKNWYYQSGTPGNYTYVRLPNPLILSAAGTICDVNGVDTIPFFYPYSELDETQVQKYYITIVNHAQTNQITRANFPYNPQDNNNDDNEGSFDNYIINNVFWRNIGTANLTNVTQMIVAPSQHDTFRYPDIQFLKNVAGGQDTVTFTKFPLTSTPALTGDITPEYYINHTCSNNGVGETQKCYQFPISLHVNTLNSVEYTVTIQAQNAGGTGTGQNTINLFLFQDCGTGVASPSPSLIASVVLSPGWVKYEFTTIFPSTDGLTLSTAGDDGLYLQVQMPLNTSCSINFTKPSLYLTNTSPINSFATYDEIDSVICTPRTGDIRTSLNSFYYYGWVPMNDGTIGNPSSNGTAIANTEAWSLYNLLWTTFAGISLGGAPLLPIYTSAGVVSTYGANAYTDWTSNKAIALTKMMGRVLLGTVPLNKLLPATTTVFGNTAGVTASNPSPGVLLFTATGSTLLNLFTGNTITFTATGGFPGNIVANTVYYVIRVTATTFQVATTYANAVAIIPVTYVSTGSGVTAYLSATGSYEGEYSHLQTVSEMPAHAHGYTHTVTNIVAPSTGATGPVATTNATTDSTGGGLPFNVTQPGTFLNMFIKL